MARQRMALDPMCGLCEEVVAQNAAHLLGCPGVADEKGRRWEEIWEDPEWCESLAEVMSMFGGYLVMPVKYGAGSGPAAGLSRQA
ncbi:hypothetical protein EV426DRAFT_700460 [Tirmania nivea]|nr:hypothetical protein EV426DRAFT_700460 [Tirmania nivea]